MREIRLLQLGLMTSMVGDSLMLLVFGIWVKSLTGSNSAAGTVLLCGAAACALSPAYGWLVDRVRRRPFLIWANVLSALMLLPLLAVRDRGDVWLIFVVAGCYGISIVASSAALNGLLKEMVADSALAGVNGWLETFRQSLRLAGPLTGAALFGWAGGQAVALADGASFLVAAGCVALLRVPERRPAPGHWRREIAAGFRHVVVEPVLRHTMVASAIAWLAFGLADASGFALIDSGLHRPPEFMGVLASLQGVGSIAGGLGSGRLIRGTGETLATALGLLCFAAGTALCLLPGLPAVLAGRVLMGGGLTVFVVGFTTVLQRTTPAPLIGRVSTAAETLTSGPQTAGMSMGALLIVFLDYRVVYAAIVVGTVLAGIYLMTGRASSRGTARAGSPATALRGTRERASAR